MRKSTLTPKCALQEFLIQYKRMSLSCGYSPSELLNERQIRTKIDVLLPSPAHAAQKKQVTENRRSIKADVGNSNNPYKEGMPYHALVCGPKQSVTPHWVPAIVVRVIGARNATVKVTSCGQIWRRHVDQLRPRHTDISESNRGTGTTLGNEVNILDRPRRNIKPNVPYNMSTKMLVFAVYGFFAFLYSIVSYRYRTKSSSVARGRGEGGYRLQFPLLACRPKCRMGKTRRF